MFWKHLHIEIIKQSFLKRTIANSTAPFLTSALMPEVSSVFLLLYCSNLCKPASSSASSLDTFISCLAKRPFLFTSGIVNPFTTDSFYNLYDNSYTLQSYSSVCYLLLVFFIQIFAYYVCVYNLDITQVNIFIKKQNPQGRTISPVGKMSFGTFTGRALLVCTSDNQFCYQELRVVQAHKEIPSTTLEQMS